MNARPELDKSELWVLQVYFEPYGLVAPHDLNRVKHELLRLSFGGGDSVIQSLLGKKVLSLSPDGQKVRLTDYGLELYRAMTVTQRDWESQRLIAVSSLDRDEVIIRAGETFKANRVLREILAQPKRELCVLDPYLGPMLFDLAEDFANVGRLRLITSENADRQVLQVYKAFRGQYPNSEMRVLGVDRIHDRFILWDGAHGVHLGHSIKDLGKKDTQINVLKAPNEQHALFEERWAEAKPIP